MSASIYLVQNKWDRSVPLPWLCSSAMDDLSSTSTGHGGGHSALVGFVWQSCSMHSSKLWVHSRAVFSPLPQACFPIRGHHVWLREAALEEMQSPGQVEVGTVGSRC